MARERNSPTLAMLSLWIGNFFLFILFADAILDIYAKEGKCFADEVKAAYVLVAVYLMLLEMQSQWSYMACIATSLIHTTWFLILPHLMCYGGESWKGLLELEMSTM